MDHLSIIVPTLNESHNIRELIAYLSTLDHSNKFQIIIVDAERSNDDLASIADNLSVIYQKSKHSQRAKQLNEGAKLSTHNHLMFLHADVRPPENFYQDIFKSFEEGNKFGFFAYRFDKSSKFMAFNERYTKGDGMFAGAGDQCHFMLKDTFNSLQGYNEQYEIMEDFDMMRKVRKMKIPYSIVKNMAKVSARKYEKNNYVKVNLTNLLVFTLYRMGVAPIKLKKMYTSLLKT